jgi:hypothetical protein
MEGLVFVTPLDRVCFGCGSIFDKKERKCFDDCLKSYCDNCMLARRCSVCSSSIESSNVIAESHRFLWVCPDHQDVQSCTGFDCNFNVCLYCIKNWKPTHSWSLTICDGNGCEEVICDACAEDDLCYCESCYSSYCINCYSKSHEHDTNTMDDAPSVESD